ncbi:MAG: host attachment protein [Rhodoferax sp.]|nr:host attachment protein [Rhodoferax sp.]
MEKTWILIANAERARCFERHATDHSLTELTDFVHPYPQTNIISETSPGDRSGDAGKGHGRTGHAGTQFESHTEPHAKERGIFARQLADYLNKGVEEHRCSALVLIATSAMLGELRPCLSSAADKMLSRCVTSDLTHYTGPELKERINHALALPD